MFSVFPSNIFDCSLSSPFQTSLKLTVSLSKKLYFCIFSTSNLQEKGMGFSILNLYFMFVVLFSWFCEMLLEFWVLWVSNMGLFLLLALGVWVLLILAIRCLICLICLSILSHLCWLVNFIPIWYVFGFSVIFSECEYGCFRMVLLIDF